MIDARWYQDEAVDSLFHYFTRFGGNPIVALPTATGKSVVIAKFLQAALELYPTTRAMVLTHVKELIGQNYRKMLEAWPQAPAGVFSAGLDRREAGYPITFGGVATVKNAVPIFGRIDLLLVDECHLISPNDESMYREIIRGLKVVNPYLKVIGFTATPYRQKQGMLTEAVITRGGERIEALFTDICYDKTKIDDFTRFVAEGYLAPLVTRPTTNSIDMHGVRTTAGDFNEKDLQAAEYPILQRALYELCEYGRDRRRWLCFNAGIENAEYAASILNSWGIPTRAVHSKIGHDERDSILKDYHDGKLRCITNNNVLTTGYDEPGIDLIGMFRPTKSVVLWVQMLGRGMRVAPWEGKTNCLCLDYAANVMRLGPVNDPNIPGRPRPNGAADAPVRLCPACGCHNHISRRSCEFCGHEFEYSENIYTQAVSQEVMVSTTAIINTYRVQHVSYYRHVKQSTGSVTLKATYHCGLSYMFSEYVGIELKSRRAYEWWMQRSGTQMPETTTEALALVPTFREPTQIVVYENSNTGFPQIMKYEWD